MTIRGRGRPRKDALEIAGASSIKDNQDIILISLEESDNTTSRRNPLRKTKNI